MRHIILVAHNLRSSLNVGALLRTAEGLGVETVWLTGYTPYPRGPADDRLPHLARRNHTQIAKTALGAEQLIAWRHAAELEPVLADLRRQGFVIAALEQAPAAVPLPDFKPPDRLALIVGREVEGIEPEILARCDHILEIPMFGHKESYNVTAAAAMALYHLRFD